ncbi:Exostosin family protein [Euphorbia peplus]|nr:Exostosin family protein [Euphorbia peplus]
MADFLCSSPPLLLYTTLFLILFFSTINNHSFHFSPHISSSYSNQTNISLEQELSTIISPSPSINLDSNNEIIASNNVSEVKMRTQIEEVEEGLARARLAILKASRTRNCSSCDNHSQRKKRFIPRGDVYINPCAFHQSYIEMEKRFRVWTYKEGELPLFHNGPVKDIYSTEGQFIAEMESGLNPFSASNPDEALVFFVPVSVVSIIKFVYSRQIHQTFAQKFQGIVYDYIQAVSAKYPFWNTSSGADHFLVSCHDWAPDVSVSHPQFYKQFIRVLCNANTSEGFIPTRDVTLPEINFPSGKHNPISLTKSPANRSVLAFFCGGNHGPVRNILLKHWKEKDKDVQVYENLPENLNYTEQMSRSKYCLCPSGWEVASPRIAESIYAGCVPVIISDYYALPFSDVLEWSKFSVHIPIAEIPEIKRVLERIPMREYLKMQKRVVQIQRHFILHRPAKSYDVINMVLHSIWLRRLNVRLPL